MDEDKIVEIIENESTQTIQYRFNENDRFNQYAPYKSREERKYFIWRTLQKAVDVTLFESGYTIHTNGWTPNAEELIVTFGHSNELRFQCPDELDLFNFEGAYNDIMSEIKRQYLTGYNRKVKFTRPETDWELIVVRE